MSKPSDLQMRQYSVCLDCSNRVGTMCHLTDSPIRWGVTRYGCGSFHRRYHAEAEDDA